MSIWLAPGSVRQHHAEQNDHHARQLHAREPLVEKFPAQKCRDRRIHVAVGADQRRRGIQREPAVGRKSQTGTEQRQKPSATGPARSASSRRDRRARARTSRTCNRPETAAAPKTSMDSTRYRCCGSTECPATRRGRSRARRVRPGARRRPAGPRASACSTVPKKPTSSPMIARRVKGWPRRPNTPRPAIQKAAVPFNNADSLLGIVRMAQELSPLLANTIISPMTST